MLRIIKIISFYLALVLLITYAPQASFFTYASAKAEDYIDIPDINLKMWINRWMDLNSLSPITKEAVSACQNPYFFMGSGVQNTDGLNEVLKLSCVTEIFMGYDQGFSDLSFLSELTKIEKIALPMESKPIQNYDVLGTLPALTELTAINVGFVDTVGITAGIANSKSLTKLNLSSNSIKSIAPLAKLKNLRSLTLDNNKGLSDISALSQITGLTYLSFVGCNVSDISSLRNLTGITEIRFSIGRIKDMSPIESFRNLSKIHIETDNLQSFNFIPKTITSLSVPSCNISDISRIAAFTNLEELNLDNNAITDLKPLAGLTKLKRLSVQNNRITSLVPLKDMSFDMLLCANNYIPVPNFKKEIPVIKEKPDTWNLPQRRLFITDLGVSIFDDTISVGKSATYGVMFKLTSDHQFYTPESDSVSHKDYELKIEGADIVKVVKKDGSIIITGLKPGTAKLTILAYGIDAFYTKQVFTITIV